MKILLLNPHFQSADPSLVALRNQGYALFCTSSPEEAQQVLGLHGSTIDLAIVHREPDGIQWIHQIKSNPAYKDLPLLLTSSEWGDPEFAQHQSTPDGANAYSKFPLSETALVELVHAIFNIQAENHKQPVHSPSEVPMAEAPAQSGFMLEEAAQIFGGPTPSEPSMEIHLEAPDLLDQSAEALSVPSGLSIPQNSLPALEPSQAADYDIKLSSEPDASIDVHSQAVPSEPIAFESASSDFSSVEAAPVIEMASSEASGSDSEVVDEMPYLSRSSREQASPLKDPLELMRPVGDSVVPGGAGQSPDTETLKKYLYLREQDVAILSSQLKSSQVQIKALDQNLREERARNVELNHVASEQKRQIEDFEREKVIALGSLETEVADLKFQLKTKSDKARLLEVQVKDATQEIERLKDRVRSDIRKIRIREKELENKLELLKRDSEALMGTREGKIVELKRKLDLLEFNMDILQDQYVREKENSAKLKELFAKAAQVVRVAGGILDNNSAPTDVTTSATPSAEEAVTKSSREAS